MQCCKRMNGAKKREAVKQLLVLALSVVLVDFSSVRHIYSKLYFHPTVPNQHYNI